jgi:hypothetical protein
MSSRRAAERHLRHLCDLKSILDVAVHGKRSAGNELDREHPAFC